MLPAPSEGRGRPLRQAAEGGEFWNRPSGILRFGLFVLSEGWDLLLKSVKMRVVVPNAVFLLTFRSVLGFPKLLQGNLSRLLKAAGLPSILGTGSGRERSDSAVFLWICY